MRQKRDWIITFGAGGATRNRTELDGFAIRYITTLPLRHVKIEKGEAACASPFFEFGAGEESRTLDLNLGKVALYQLSYSRLRSR